MSSSRFTGGEGILSRPSPGKRSDYSRVIRVTGFIERAMCTKGVSTLRHSFLPPLRHRSLVNFILVSSWFLCQPRTKNFSSRNRWETK